MEIDLEEEKNTEAYQETLNSDIEIFDRIENIHQHHKTHWMKINKVIQQDFFEETDIFPYQFLKQCNNNSIKNNLVYFIKCVKRG